MLRYISGRLLQAVLSVIVVSLFVFTFARISGDPVQLMAPSDAKPRDLQILRESLGFDQPLHVQYIAFVSNALRGDFGKSVRWGQPAAALVVDRMPATFQLALGAMLIALAFALPIGVFSALKPGSLVDTLGKFIALLGQSMPSFWIGIMLIMVVAVGWRLLPVGGRDGIESLVLPSISLGWFLVAAVARVTRSAMLEVLSSEYIKMARAKGVPESHVLWKHALRNAAIPVLTLSSLQFAGLLNGAVVVEIIFAWPGVGRIAVEAIQARDYAVVQAAVLLTATVFLAINLAVDVLYAYVDPRIKYR